VDEDVMNNRIKELMQEAMEPNGVEGIGGSYMEFNPERFAEMIIRECELICCIAGARKDGYECANLIRERLRSWS
jgi:hypothetical protein